MATQYTAGLTTGQVLTAATMNSIGAAWETWTPTISAQAGTITSGTTTQARYARIQKLVFVQFNYTITTVGTAVNSNLQFTLPITQLAAYPAGQVLGFGREYVTAGFMLQAFYIPTLCRVTNYAGSGWMQSGQSATISLVYEAA